MDAGTALTTPYGIVRLVHAGPLEFRAEAGISTPPMTVAGRRVCVSLGFGYHHATRRFGLMAEARRVAWSPEGLPLDKATWQAAAEAAVTATEAHLSERRGITALAETTLLRQRLTRLGRGTADATERMALMGQIGRSRRGLVVCVG